MQNKIKLLIIGDIIGKGARNAFINYIPALKAKYNYDILAVNGENTTHGSGLSKKHYELLTDSGVDIITMGNHIFDKKEISSYAKNAKKLVVPGNIVYKDDSFDNNKVVTINFKNRKINFINLVGQSVSKGKYETYEPIKFFNQVYKEDEIFILDFHAEFTMEKEIMGFYLDGKASLVYGTHTHVQTADEKILPKKSAYISDVGMVGSYFSVIGYNYDEFIDDTKTKTYVSEKTPYMINGIYVEIDLDTKEALKIERINQTI